jgi:hypothetical protein
MARLTTRRCRSSLLVVGVLFLWTHTTRAQIFEPFLAVTKTCPSSSASGVVVTCTFTVENLNERGVSDLAVTNQAPFPDGPVVALACNQEGVAVTSLGPAGSPTDSCAGSVQETTPFNCTASDQPFVDQISATSLDIGPDPFTGLPVAGRATNAVSVTPLDCNDGNACTTDSCSSTTGCASTPDPSCPVTEICRNAGFWGTHGGTETGGSTNIALALLETYNSANGSDLVICGQTISNTTLGSANSAVEAICIDRKADGRLQLARELMAAALNCIISRAAGDPTAPVCDVGAGLAGDVCAGVSITEIFAACNAVCPTGTTAEILVEGNPTEISCIGALDCFNNGGDFDPTSGECSSSPETCLDNELVNGCFDFEPQGPPGSPRACNDSRRNDIVVVPPLP